MNFIVLALSLIATSVYSQEQIAKDCFEKETRKLMQSAKKNRAYNEAAMQEIIDKCTKEAVQKNKPQSKFKLKNKRKMSLQSFIKATEYQVKTKYGKEWKTMSTKRQKAILWTVCVRSDKERQFPVDKLVEACDKNYKVDLLK